MSKDFDERIKILKSTGTQETSVLLRDIELIFASMKHENAELRERNAGLKNQLVSVEKRAKDAMTTAFSRVKKYVTDEINLISAEYDTK